MFKAKKIWAGGYGAGGGKQQPRRMMLAADLGLDLLIGEYDPILLAVGIKTPRLKVKTLQIMRVTNAGRAYQQQHVLTKDERKQRRDTYRYTRSVAGKIDRQHVQEILKRLRYFGEVRNK